MRTLILLSSEGGKDELLEQLAQLRKLFIDEPTVSCLVLDDARMDGTEEAVSRYLSEQPWTACRVVRNPFPLGPGGVQKIGYRHALEEGLDSVLVIHDASSALLSAVPHLVERFGQELRADYWLTSEHFRWSRPRLWPRWLHHRMLSIIESRLSGSPIVDWHGPMRLYRTSALREIAFELNAHEGHFHTEVLLQLIAAGRRRLGTFTLENSDLRRPLRPKVSSWPTLKAALKYRLQRYSLFYDFRYHPELILGQDVIAKRPAPHYTQKLESDSPHSRVCRDDELIPPKSRVLDLGCASGYVARQLIEKKQCEVVGVDLLEAAQVAGGFEYHRLNLDRDTDQICRIIENRPFDVILLLDVLEHLSMPESFLLVLSRCRYQKPPRIIVSTGNVGFFIVRLMLLCGYFNYGNKGILDITHKRLFTVRTFKNLLDQTGFRILKRCGFPLPWRELGLPSALCRPLDAIHGWFVRVRPTLFAYQVMYVTSPLGLTPHQRAKR